MAEFTPITSQEQFDALIKDRLAREGKKYAEYKSPDEVAAAVSKAENEKAGLVAQLTAKDEALAKLTKDCDAKDLQIKTLNATILKGKIAHDAGLKYEAAAFLTGESEEEIAKSAEALKGIVGTTGFMPQANPEQGVGTDGKDAALRELARNIVPKN